MSDLRVEKRGRENMESKPSTCLFVCRKCAILAVITTLSVINFLYVAKVSALDDLLKQNETQERLLPTVSIAVLIRNKAHTLPWFLGHIEKLDYPKDRINLWFRSDHNIDNTTAMLREWLSAMKSQYHHVDVEIDDKNRGYPDERTNCHWTDQRFDRVIALRQQALDNARDMWADFLFMLDADVILANNRTLQILIEQEKTIIGPMLNTSVEGIYSNFWGGMNDEGFYKRTPEYIPIVDREKLGVFAVPMVHSAVLIDLRRKVSRQFSYSTPPKDYTGSIDDIIIFAHTVKAAGVQFHVINSHYFGTVDVPLDENYNLDYEKDQFTHTKLEAMVEGPPLHASPHITQPDIPADKMGFDQVYMINLLRRPERRKRMVDTLYDLGIQAKIVDAVDGQQLNDTYLDSLNIDMLPGYQDPYSHRALTFGEIGCFLSHYFIWVEAVEKGYEKILVLEDDVRFEPYFRKKFNIMMGDADRFVPDWELVYLGRKILQTRYEDLVEGTETLVWPSYSYWTLSYMMKLSGIRKLLNQKPLTKMIPVDEFLPIMFDKHPEREWLIQFEPRNLVGLSASPLLVFPTHYTGEPNYISDTEESSIIETEEIDPTFDLNGVPDSGGQCKNGECVHDEF